ncbi:hypothetical protein BCR35DRAFT_298222 [Leucosporidium creatinivorum]|uniref:Uncharacterized protein n=1 Tax=Leucosporidium creatinivorum TaxID=106004 RepID=A0A1Y2G5E5_9BASI|nr:hypothetical protein BCR35DRAFT_298222 [Leucosporidium creatinivorum]
MVEDALPLPPVLPLPQPSGNFSPLAEVSLDTSIDFSDLASRLFAFNHLTEVESNFSAISSDRPSSSTSSSFDLPASSYASSISYTSLDSSFLPTYFPSQALSSSPLPVLDSSDYFAALQPVPSLSTSSFDSFETSSSNPYPSYDLSSLFLAAPAPQSISAEPSYFDMPPPIEKQEWPEQGLPMSSGGFEMGGIPLTPGWSIDYSALALHSAMF